MRRIHSWKNRLLSVDGKIVLIKSTRVNSGLFVDSNISSNGNFNSIGNTFANFLWGSFENENNFTGLDGKICVPKEESGVGFRTLEDVYIAFSIKLWWRFRQGWSLLADFMRAKYCPQAHPCMVDLIPQSSHTWRHMFRVRDLAEKHIGWIVRMGDANFWLDNGVRVSSH